MEYFARLSDLYLHPHKKAMFFALVLALISSFSSFTFSYLSKIMVDDVLQIGKQAKAQPVYRIPARENRGFNLDERGSGNTSTGGGSWRGLPLATNRFESIRLLWIVFFLFVCLRIFLAGTSWIYSYEITRIGQAVVLRIRQDVYTKLQRLQVSYFDWFQTGKIMARVMDDVNAVQSSISTIFIRFFTHIATLLIGLSILFYIHAGLAALSLITLPCYVIIYQTFLRRIRVLSRMIRERNAAVYGVIGDYVNGVRVMMAFARELRELKRFFNALSDYLRFRVRQSILDTSLSVLCGLISGVGSTVVIYWGLLLVRDGQITLGDFLYFNGSVGMLFAPVVALSNMSVNIQRVRAALERIFEVLDEEVSIADEEDAIQMNEVHGDVTFQNVSLSYSKQGREALHWINFGVLPGQLVCVVGASGAGKTTLANLLLRFYSPTEGRITVDGEDLESIGLSSLRKRIRMVPQEPILFSGTLAENICYGYPEATPKEVIRAAKAAELHDFIMTLPAKYETHIGEGGMSLSGGQKQRMALAMALLTDPSVLILDDSTSALDAKTEARIHKTLERTLVGRTAFVITQKVSMARKADLVLVLEKGRLVEWGTHEVLVGKRGVYYGLFETQLSDEEKNLEVDALMV